MDLAGFQGKVAAVGPATKAAAEAAGLAVSLVPNEFLTDAIAGALGDVCGRTIFLPRSRIARKSLADELRDRGAQVIEADAYDAIPAAPEIDVLRKTDRIDQCHWGSRHARARTIWTRVRTPGHHSRPRQSGRHEGAG